MNKVYLCDNLEFMKGISDNYYELAIVDPPYNINVANDERFGKKFKNSACKRTDYIKKDWDNECPTIEYFKELFRISKNQIIWGVNYYPYDFLSGGRIFWNKNVAQNYSASKGEIAYKSIGYGVDLFNYTWSGMRQENMKDKEIRIHPTQKPIALYKWLLENYAHKGDKIFDSHVGSGSSRIACYDLGYDFEGCEIDKDYWQAQEDRFNKHISQLSLFTPEELEPAKEYEQDNLF